jgi:copper chaperone
MKTSKFKTNIKCSGCIAKATPFLDAALGQSNWEVDTNNPSKILTVSGDNDPSTVVKIVENAGFKASPLEHDDDKEGSII